jgi:hypothetical protein
VSLDWQKEIADMYRAFPAHEVAIAYGYRRIARVGPKTDLNWPSVMRMGLVFRVTALVDIELPASSLDEALALAGTAGTTVRIITLEQVHPIRGVDDMYALQQPPRGGPSMIQKSPATGTVSTVAVFGL